MTVESSGSRWDGNGLDSVALALDLLLEEVERESERVNRTGSDALLNGDHDTAEASLARSKVLAIFRDKADALHKEWKKLAVSIDRGGDEEPDSARRNLGRLSKGLKTTEQEYVEPILRVLIEMGGHGKCADVVKRVGQAMQPVLRDVDRKLLPSDGTPRWQKTVNWARFRMVKDGLLKSSSPHGIWEITEEGRAHLGL